MDDEGEVLEVMAQPHRNKQVAFKIIKHRYIQDEILSDKLGSYGAALRAPGFGSTLC